jgi:eukaryotic-like serine/threonine-protein kinase
VSLSPGTRVGVYEIIEALGAGGMGEVYRARDTKLGRSVAIKILPDAVASDSDRIARFEREAKVLASLTHANIAALYGMEVAASTDVGQAARHYLAMELVEGETLAERLQRGPLKTAAALHIARQIIDALEAAHEQGIVHRDLKPANVKITPDETVKVLDFGLAKAMEQGSRAGSHASAQRANSPTLSMMATQAGIVLGTAAYMSPEQAKGANADQRSDVFSFGVVLYEMLTCRQPFQGETAPEIMASVMVRDPDLSALPPNLHLRLRSVISRCLEKQPKQRWQAIGDLRVELEAIAATPHEMTDSRALTSARPIWQLALATAIIIAVTAGITGGVMWRMLRPATPSLMRFEVPLAEGQRFAATGRQFLAVSPDGKRIAFVIGSGSGRALLMTRALDDLEARPVGGPNLPITNSPFFSPDGQWIGFWSGGDSTLKKVAVAGGAAVTLGKADNPLGARWDGDWVVFGQSTGIMRVAAGGGEPELIARVDPPEIASSPQLINDGRTLLFAVASGSESDRWDKASIVVQSIGSDERRVLVRGGAAPRFVSTGHLLYAVGGTLLALRFDPQTVRVSGAPVPVVESVLRSTPVMFVGAVQLGVSDEGTLVYAPGGTSLSGQLTLGLIDRDGKAQPLPVPANSYQTPRASPDGRQVAVATDDGKEAIVWIHTLSGTGPPRRLTFGGRNRHPIWTRDGRSIIFQSDRDGDLGLFQQRADGSGQAERLTTAEKGDEHMPASLAPDGTLVFTITKPSAASALWALATTGDRTPRVLSPIPGKALVSPAFSPDGRWLAYGSNELGLSGYYVFVQPFPPTGAKYQVTTSISSTPVWTSDGKQILTAYTDQVSANDVQTTPQFTAGAAIRIRSEGSLGSAPATRNFDVMPDGRLLVVLPVSSTVSNAAPTAPRINVVLNWFEELKGKVK